LDLLDDAAMGPLAGAQAGNPLGLPPAKRRRKSGSNKTLFVALGSLAGVGALVICCGIGTAFLGPAFEAARVAAIRAKARDAAAKGAPIPVVLALPPGAVVADPGAPTGPVWSPDPQFASQLTANVAFDQYLLQIPAGFTVPMPPSTTNLLGTKAQDWYWASQPLPNGARDLISAEVLEFTVAPQRFANDLEAELAQRMASKSKDDGSSGFEHTPGERGQIGGIQFIRSNYSASRRGGRIYGSLSLAIDGNRMLELHALSHSAPGTPEYQLLDAALLSFRKR
jgi:hypothetical protein